MRLLQVPAFFAAVAVSLTGAAPTAGTFTSAREPFKAPCPPTGIFYDEPVDILYISCGTQADGSHKMYAFTTAGRQKCEITINANRGISHGDGFSVWGRQAYIADTEGSLLDLGDPGCTADNQCQRCSGDCDSDDECAGDLVCFRRGVLGGNEVPGCISGGSGDISTHDYCSPKECEWLRHDGKYSGGFAEKEGTQWNLSTAKTKCIELGKNKCKAITCDAASAWCSLRSAEELTDSTTGETTYMADTTTSCFEAKTLQAKLGGAVLKAKWNNPCSCLQGTCQKDNANWNPQVQQTYLLSKYSEEIADGGGIDDYFRNSGVVVKDPYLYAVNGMIKAGAYPKSLVKFQMGGTEIAKKWSFTAQTLGHAVDMRGLTCGPDNCAQYIYIGDEKNYIYKLKVSGKKEAAEAVEEEWDIDSVVAPRSVNRGDRGIGCLTYSITTGYFYVGIKETSEIHVLKLDGVGAPDTALVSGSYTNSIASVICAVLCLITCLVE